MLYRFEDIEKSYGPHDVLRGVTWQHNPGEKVGLVGRNGAGKTTLFKLLLREEDPDRGEIIRASALTIGHLSQHLDAERGMTLFDYVETAFADVLAIEQKMRAIEHDLSDPATDHPRLLEKYAELQHEYEHANGYKLHAEVERVLTGVGFVKADYERQQEFVERTQEFIRRNIAGQKTKQAKSRRKMLAKLDEAERPEIDETFANFRLEAGPRSGAVALTADRVTAGYDATPIVSDFSMVIRRGERYAIMGPNGSGKSTVLKTFAGRLQPVAGAIAYGHNVQVGYYDQTLGD